MAAIPFSAFKNFNHFRSYFDDDDENDENYIQSFPNLSKTKESRKKITAKYKFRQWAIRSFMNIYASFLYKSLTILK